MPNTLSIKFTVEGVPEMSRRYRLNAIRITDLSPEFREIGRYLKDVFGNEAFETKGAAIGSPWKQAKKDYGHELMEDTGRLRRGFRATSGKLRVVVRNTVPYFKFHQSRKLPRTHLPRRPMMALPPRVSARVIQYITKGINRALQP